MAEPGGVLTRIVARKRADVAARLAGQSIGDLHARAELTRRSLRDVLARPGARFIMEIKRASPSGLRTGADPRTMAAAYRGAADAMSVLTDSPYFGGSLDDLGAVRELFDGPILAKDFIVDPRQVAEARMHGADAVLAMLSVLDDEGAAAVMAEADRLGMDVITEVHDERELRRAIAMGAPIIGINNRDLATLEVDLSITERLAPLVPAGRLVVAESGIACRADVERLARLADAFLVGSSLMRAADPAAAARSLAFGRVKLCGLTRAEDVAMAAARGATHAGFILVPGTPRAVSPAETIPLADVARRSDLKTVGVFRDEKPGRVAVGARDLALDAVQLHGQEDDAYIAVLRTLLPQNTEIWSATAVGNAVAAPRCGADRTLFDTSVNGRTGGTGVAFDWTRIAARPELSSAFLAGGICAANARAAARVGAHGLDVSSGVESAPGRKDAAKVEALFEALRPPCRGEAPPCA